jgi:tRNA(Leu) C34 or U34 (ribose-2'-O)-methylase TrmL
MHIALYQPDIPQNAATIIRMAACLGVAVNLIEPAGFLLGDRQFRRAGLIMSRAPTCFAIRPGMISRRRGRPGD